MTPLEQASIAFINIGVRNVAQNIGDEPAFPFQADGIFYSGLTKREWLVGMALKGLMSNKYIMEGLRVECSGGESRDAVAAMASGAVGAVLAELEKE